MGLVKKYNSGGSFSDYVRERLAKGDLSLTNKSYPIINQRLNSFDENNSNVGEVKKNWAGQVVANTPETADAFLANLYQDYKKTTSNVSPITPKEGWGPVDRSIGDLATYIANKDYGGNKEYAAQEISKMKDNNQVKQYVAKRARDLLSDYITKASENPSDNWKDLDKIKKVYYNISNINYDNITDDDWDKLKAWTNQLDWQTGRFLIPDAEFEKREQDTKAKEERTNAENAVTTYKNVGITAPEMQNTLYQSGFSKLASDLNPYLNNYFKNKKYSVLSNDAGDYKIIKGNELVSGDSGVLTTDVFSPDYGKTFYIDNGTLHIFNKGEKPEDLKIDIPDEGNIVKQLVFAEDVPGFSQKEGWVAFSDAGDELTGDVARDDLGRRDYLKNITFYNRNSEHSVKATRQDDGTYITQDGTVIKPKIKQFGVSAPMVSDPVKALWNNPKLPSLKNIPVKYSKDYSRGDYLGTALQDLYSIEQEINNANTEGRSARIDTGRLKKIAAALKYYGVYGNNRQRELANQNSVKLSKISAISDSSGKPLFQLYKKGGVLKAATGASLEDIVRANERYAGKVATSSEPTATAPSTGITGVKDVSRAIKNADPLDIISLAGSAASFIPGVGVVGGLVSTGADVAKGIKEGWDKEDTMNLLGNLGFTLLAGLGLGAAKAGKVAGQTSKVIKGIKSLDKAEDLTKMAKTLGATDEVVKSAESLAKLGKGLGEEKKLSTFIKSSKAFNKTEDVTKLNKALKSAGYSKVKNKEELLEVLGKDLDNVSDLTKLSQGTFINEVRGIAEGAKKATDFIVNKTPRALKVPVALGTAAYGLQGVGALASNIKEEGLAGIGNTSVDDIRRIVQLGSLARIGYKNRQYSQAKKLNTQIVGATPSKTTVNVEGKQFNVEGDLRQKDLNKGVNVFGKSFFSGKSQENKKEFLNQLKTKLPDADKKALDDILNKESIGKIEFKFTPSKGGRTVLNAASRSLDYKDVKSYNIAKKQLERGYTQYGTLSRLKNKGNKVEVESIPTEKSPVKKVRKTKVPKKDIGGLLSIIGNNINTPKLGYENPLASKSWYKGLQNNSTPTFEELYSKVNLPKSLSDNAPKTDATFPNFTPVPYTKKPYKDLGTLFNTLQYGLTNLYNDRSTNWQVRAASEIPKLSTMDYTYLKTGTPYSNYASKQAAEMRGYGNRLGTNISDIDKANAYRLQANKQASDVELQGKYRDIEANSQTAAKQAELNNRVAAYNTDIMNKVSALGSQARSNIYKLYANNEAYKSANTQNFLKYLTYTASERPYKEASWNYAQETLNPNIMGAYEYLDKLQTGGLETYKKAYEDYYNNLEKNSPEYLNKPEFENSKFYKKYQDEVNASNDRINALNKNLYTLQRGVSALSPYGAYYAQPSYAKGGSLTLDDRIVLESVKTANKRALKREEMFYKQLLDNNKLVQAALIKVFK